MLGAETLTVANLVNNLGVTVSVQGRHSEAERLYRDAYETHRVLFGERHWRTANVTRNVGRALALQQRYREAVAWMDRAIEALSSVDPADLPNGPAGLFGMRAQRAHMLFRLNQRQDGMAQAEAAVSDLERLPPANAAHALAFSRVILGRMLNDIGRPRNGEPILAKALGGVENLGPKHPQYAEALCELTRARVLQGAGPRISSASASVCQSIEAGASPNARLSPASRRCWRRILANAPPLVGQFTEPARRSRSPRAAWRESSC